MPLVSRSLIESFDLPRSRTRVGSATLFRLEHRSWLALQLLIHCWMWWKLTSEAVSPDVCVLQVIMVHGENGLSMRKYAVSYTASQRVCAVHEETH